jgi:L-threonylcarbamoyladenylate synthase
MSSGEVGRAVEILRGGGLVAFPTETVYGLGADATNADAVAKIFAVKGRPPTNPLIVHVADAATARRFAADWPLAASHLAERFWPGALTLVLPRTAEIVRAVTAGGETVGLRVPAHPLALQLLRKFGGPVAAPSANKSNRISPTTAQHVRDELGDAVDLILDGGRCGVGIESTVLDLAARWPTVLRPGAVTREQIEAVIGVAVSDAAGDPPDHTVARSPGQQLLHYAPRARAFRFQPARLREALAAVRQMEPSPGPVGIICFESLGWGGYPLAIMPNEPPAYARELYATMRSVDDTLAELPRQKPWSPTGLILIEMPPDRPEWAAVRDRIIRATAPLE